MRYADQTNGVRNSKLKIKDTVFIEQHQKNKKMSAYVFKKTEIKDQLTEKGKCLRGDIF